MGDIIQFPGLNIECSTFTSDALNRFRDIPKYIMKQMLESVFCPVCGNGTTIIAFSGRMKGYDLILNGKCKNCWGEVERLIDYHEDKSMRITS
jgi:hypothetical protein